MKGSTWSRRCSLLLVVAGLVWVTPQCGGVKDIVCGRVPVRGTEPGSCTVIGGGLT